MTLVNPQKTANFISNWIKEYFTKHGRKTAILNFSGNINSLLTALLIKKTGIPLLCLNISYQNPDLSYYQNLINNFDLPLIKIDLTSIYENFYEKIINKPVGLFKEELYNMLCAPVLASYAKINHGLIIGTSNRSESKLLRNYQKIGNGCVDIAPIADLFRNEAEDLLAFLLLEEYNNLELKTTLKVEAEKINHVHLNDHLDDYLDEHLDDYLDDYLEWADRENMRTSINGRQGIIEDESDPVKHPAWLGYTGHQRQLIAKLHAIEKATRHKFNPALPICQVRKIEGLVR